MTNPKNEDILIITARDAGTWLREKFTPSGITRWFGEGLIGDYRKKMEILRQVDDNIYDWSQELGRTVKELRRAIKANRLIDVAVLIGSLNKRLTDIQTAGSAIKEIAEEDITSFEMEHDLALEDEGMVAEAGAWSDFKREWVAKRLETKERKARVKALQAVLKKSEDTVRAVEKHVKELGRARAEGNIGQYLLVLRLIADAQQDFVGTFKPVYKKYLSPLVERALQKEKAQEAGEEEAPVKEEVPEEEAPAPRAKKRTAPADLGPLQMPQAESVNVPSGRPEPVTEPVPVAGSHSSEVPTRQQPLAGPQSEVPTRQRPLFDLLGPDGVDEDPSTLPSARDQEEDSMLQTRIPFEGMASPELLSAIMKVSHENFLIELSKIAQSEDPFLMAAMIVRYAGEVEDYDLDASLKLIAVAEGILDA